MPGTDVEAIKVQIREAFTHTAYPGDGRLSNSREGPEPEALEDEFKGRTDWRTLDPSFIDQAPDGWGSALHFFSDEAFRFYLPAYLVADLDRKLVHADVVFSLTFGLDNETRGKAINPRRYGERTWFEYKRDRFAAFTAQEVSAIVRYLKHTASGDRLTEGEKQRIHEALGNYWTARAAD